jgi:hypothetical protein
MGPDLCATPPAPWAGSIRRILAGAGLATALALTSGATPTSAQEAPRWSPTPSITGLSGLIRMPTADIMRSDRWRFSYTSPQTKWDPNVGATAGPALGMSFLPRTEMAFAMGSRNQGFFDLTFHGKLQLAPPRLGRPGLAVGMVDAGRSDQTSGGTKFAVATLPLLSGRASLSAGVAGGETQGLFGGVSWRPIQALELQAEYDTERLNSSLVLHAGDMAFARVADLNSGKVVGIGVELPFEYPAKLRAPAEATGRGTGTEAATEALVGLGFEDVRVWTAEGGAVLAASYENRTYTLSEQDGIRAGMAALAGCAPRGASRLAVELTRRGVATVRATAPVGGAEGPLSIEAPQPGAGSEVRPANPSWGHADVQIGLGLKTQVGSNYGALRGGALALPEVVLPVARGLVLNARYSYPAVGGEVSGMPRRLTNDRAIAAYAFRPGGGWLAQVSGGRYPSNCDGAVLELARPVSDRGLLHLVGGRADNNRLGTRAYLLGEYWHWFPKEAIQVRLLGGRFITNDRGVGFDVMRWWGDVRVGFGVRDTSRTRTAQISASLPLGPRAQTSRPGTARLRIADRLDHTVRTVIKGDHNSLYLLEETGGELQIGQDLVTSFFDRGRLLPGSGLWGR